MTDKTEKKPAPKRYYVVIDGDATRIVNATSPGAAVAHVFKPVVRVASQSDLATLLPKGVKIEEID